MQTDFASVATTPNFAWFDADDATNMEGPTDTLFGVVQWALSQLTTHQYNVKAGDEWSRTRCPRRPQQRLQPAAHDRRLPRASPTHQQRQVRPTHERILAIVRLAPSNRGYSFAVGDAHIHKHRQYEYGNYGSAGRREINVDNVSDQRQGDRSGETDYRLPQCTDSANRG